MGKTKVGLLTIGQSPRIDVVPEIKSLLSPQVEVIEAGLLDNRRAHEIQRLQPDPGEVPLVTRLRNGRQVLLGESKISALLSEAVHSLREEKAVDLVGILCTNEFPPAEFSLPVLFPFDYLCLLINHVLQAKRFGVIVPLEDQVGMTEKKWGRERAIVAVKSPYAKGESWEAVAKEFVPLRIGAVILDCIGYKISDKQELQKFLAVPILLPRLILALAINQLY